MDPQDASQTSPAEPSAQIPVSQSTPTQAPDGASSVQSSGDQITAGQASAVSPSPQASATGEAPKGPKKILLVEDDDSLANVYMTRLQAEGFGVKRVPNGEDALAVAMQYRPDLILLDVMMPKVSGFDVLDIIRNTPEIGNVKVIMLTALSQEADKKRAEALGVDDYLVKSQVVIADVVDKIKQHLGL